MRITDLDAYKSPWLSAADLGGRPRRLTISEWGLQKVRNRDNSEQQKVRLAFSGAKKQMLLNTTQGKVLDGALGEIEKWVGKTIILQPARAANGAETIEIVIPAQPAPQQAANERQAAPAATEAAGATEIPKSEGGAPASPFGDDPPA